MKEKHVLKSKFLEDFYLQFWLNNKLVRTLDICKKIKVSEKQNR